MGRRRRTIHIIKKVTNLKYLELGISSNFIASHYLEIFNIFLTLIILYMIRLASRFTDKNGLLYRFFNQDYVDVIFGIILSNIAQILLPYQYVLSSLSFPNFNSKLNLFLQTIFMGFFLIFLSFMITFIGIKKVFYKKGVQKKLLSQNKNF